MVLSTPDEHEASWISPIVILIVTLCLCVVLVLVLTYQDNLWIWNRMSSTRRRLKSLRHHFRHALRTKMDIMFDSYLNSDFSGGSGSGWDFPNVDSPAWVFGRSYSVNYDLEELRRSVSTCLWVSYRKNFAPLGPSALTSDKGWGCMIRTGQMLLAKALLLRHLGQDWHWTAECRDAAYLKIVSLLEDKPCAPFSLHQIAEMGASLGKPVGAWLGPNTVAQALKKLLASGASSVDLGMHIAMDSTLVASEVKRVALAHPVIAPFAAPTIPSTYIVNTPRGDPKWKPLLLIVPLRLGLADLNASYVPGIKAVFEIPQCIGIIGGRPNHALYFIGYAENEVLYLDPHTVQPSVTIGAKHSAEELSADESYHSPKPGRMSFLSMDPSIALCFYCASELEFDALCKRLTERFASAPLPLFEICERRPNNDLSWACSSIQQLGTSNCSKRIMTLSNSPSPRGSSDGDDEEFEILG